jgi:CDP-glucose 4,6-dehydratase
MWNNLTGYYEGRNVGPDVDGVSTVCEVATEVIKNYGFVELKDSSDPNVLHEAKLLLLNINKAKTRLGWNPRMNMQKCVELVSNGTSVIRTKMHITSELKK